MDRLHIAFVTLPHSPHVFPTLPIVASLIRRGYRVTYATSERFSAAVENVGAEIVPCPMLLVDSGVKAQNPQKEVREEPFLEFTNRMLDGIRPFYERNSPDLLLYDFMAFSGRILAKRLGAPAIQTSPFYALENENFEYQVRHEKFRKLLVEESKTIAKYLRAYDISSINCRTDKEQLNIYLFPRVLQPNSHLFGRSCFFAGRCPAERSRSGAWQDNSDGRPIALISMSTIFAASTGAAEIPDHFRICIEALVGLGWHIVLSIGERCDPAALLPLPPHCEIVQHASYLNVLSRASILFFMSGIVSTAEAAYHGVPMVAISSGVEEFEWQADHIVELGIGVHIRKEDISAQSLRRAAVRLSADQHVLNRVRELRHAVRREPGAEETANRIEEFLDAGPD